MALIYNASFDSTTRVLSLLDKAGNVISSCEVPSKELVDDPKKPLMFRAIADNSVVALSKYGTLSNTYQTSTDGTNWTDYTLGTQISLNKEDVVYFRCSNHPTTQTTNDYVYFSMTGRIEAWHNAYSMISSDFSSAEGSVGDYGMYDLFSHCSSLTKAPLLLNALSPYCYYGMFWYCDSLTQAPALPATTLAPWCYASMFSNCRSLTQAPALPATTLAEGCYASMFRYCDSLTQAPALPATTLAPRCYYGMFEYSPKLNEVRISATTTATNALKEWLKNVSATGDFYCDPNATIFPTDSVSGIPSGWKRRDINLINALTLTATADNSSVKLTKNGTLDNTFEVDTGNGWTAYEFDTVIPLNAGQSCKWRCSAHPTTQSLENYVKFVMTGAIGASGNCNSMLSSDFDNMTSLSGYDYAFMSLFNGCEALTQAPSLPATTLAKTCYGSMFLGCKALKQAPFLPATTLVNYCYNYTFQNCRSLNEVRIAATTTAKDSLYIWLYNVSSTGDFYCDPNANIFPTDSSSGIPSGWTRKPLSDYPNP